MDFRRRRRRIKLRQGGGSAVNLVRGKEKKKLELASRVFKRYSSLHLISIQAH